MIMVVGGGNLVLGDVVVVEEEEEEKFGRTDKRMSSVARYLEITRSTQFNTAINHPRSLEQH